MHFLITKIGPELVKGCWQSANKLIYKKSTSGAVKNELMAILQTGFVTKLGGGWGRTYILHILPSVPSPPPAPLLI